MYISAKKHLGQHFLTDPSIARRIVQSLLPGEYQTVLEIGPGKGILTTFLIDQETNFIAIDIDPRSVAYLHERFPLQQDRILLGDFLKVNLAELIRGNLAIIGNFPYNISSQILFKMLAFRERVTQLVGMFQKEVAQRICALPKSKEYGILSVLTQAFYEPKYLFTVESGSFFPAPKVKSGVLRLVRRSGLTLICNEDLFFRLVKTAFGQRRKTLRNALASLLTEQMVKEGFSFSSQRAEELSVHDFVLLALELEHIKSLR